MTEGTLPFGRLIDAHAESTPSAPAVTCGEVSLDWADLGRRTSRLARWMLDRGVLQGSTVVTALPNSVELVECAVAIWKVGAIPLLLPPTMPAGERGPVLELAKPALVLDRRLPVDELAAFDDGPLPAAVSPNWRASTSGGSTGRPKLIFTDSPSVTDPDLRTLHLTRGGCLVVPGPLYHGAPFLFTTFGLMRGKHVVLLPKFDPEQTLALCAEHQADYLQLVPTMMNRMVKLPTKVKQRHDLSALRTMLHLGASCPPDLKRAWIDWLGPTKVHELYAGTEGQAMTWIRGDEWLAHPGSVGRPVGGAEMRTFDENGEILPPGTVGEIFMRPPAGARTTYRYVGASATRHGDWETLGDLGSVDADGYVYILDRRTDMILSGGANVYPAEVEAALEAHPGVAAAVVVGLPHPDLGRTVHAIVEASEPTLDEETLRTYLADRLVRYKTPRTFEFSTTPLRNEIGKVRRTELAAERSAATTTTTDATPTGTAR